MKIFFRLLFLSLSLPLLVFSQQKITWEKDGKGMMLIPAGSFEMGDYFNEGNGNERPVHTVTLDDFYMDATEVTNAQYAVFMEQTGHRQPNSWTNSTYNQPNQPVVGVDWNDAVAYAEWAGKRLPTEAAWEYAARGGLVGQRYVWGDDEKLARDYANYEWVEGKDKWELCSPVGSFKPNGYGLYDMAGNVLEWCADRYDGNYYTNSPANNPQGREDSIYKYRVLRGGSWLALTNSLRVAYRPIDNPNSRYIYYGFRCVSGSN